MLELDEIIEIAFQVKMNLQGNFIFYTEEQSIYDFGFSHSGLFLVYYIASVLKKKLLLEMRLENTIFTKAKRFNFLAVDNKYPYDQFLLTSIAQQIIFALYSTWYILFTKLCANCWWIAI